MKFFLDECKFLFTTYMTPSAHFPSLNATQK